MFRRILLASDGSEHAERATDEAIRLMYSNVLEEIIVLYVVDGATSKSDVIVEGDRNTLLEKRRKRLHVTEQKLITANIPYEVKILKGDPGPTIVQYANSYNFDVVVIGSRGLNGFQEMVLGSVSHKVAKRVDCPVLIVK
ncbi:TPA: universal stress protein [Streptococcus pyogenes]|nr:universal stress protein [Streptococcus pyogenes]